VLGGLGVFKGGEYLAQLWKERRKSLAEAAAVEAKTEQESIAADHEMARAARKDTIAELGAIIAQKDADIAQLKAGLESYKTYAHERIDAGNARILAMHAERTVEAGAAARVEERLKACEEDRAELRKDLALIRGRLDKLENRPEQ
jgi:chromosome segregation ATPase